METQNDVLLNEENKEENSLNFDSSENVFTREVKPINRFVYFLMELGQTLFGALMWVVNFIISIFISLGEFFIMVGKGVYKGAIGIYKFFERKCHQFRYNDKFGRLSYLLFGVGSIAHGQKVNGILYIVTQVIYLTCFIIFGVPAIALLKTLGTIEFGSTSSSDPDDMFGDSDPGSFHNSVLILIFGLLWIFSILIYLYLWNKSINAGYNNYRIKNFKRYEGYSKECKEFARELDKKAEEAFKNGVSRAQFTKTSKQLINEFVSGLSDSDNIEKINYIKFLLNNVVGHAYTQQKKLVAENKKVQKRARWHQEFVAYRQRSLEKLVTNSKALYKDAEEKGELGEEQLEALLAKQKVKVEKHKNNTMLFGNKLQQKVTKATHHMHEVMKRYSPYVEMQEKRNNDKYGKFNRYYKKVADFDVEIKFYNNYKKYADIYTGSLNGYIKKNEDNANQITELGVQLKHKLEATNIKFDNILARRKELESELKKVKEKYKEEVTLLKQENASEEKFADAKGKLVVSCTRINGALHDLPSVKLVKEMRREELKESKHAYTRDKRYLITNFTSETFAKEQVIDAMLVDERFEYKDAVYYSSVLVEKVQQNASEEEINAILSEVISKKEQYMSDHEDKYEGINKTFKEQIRSLADEKFHISILLLPIGGIVLMCILPLFISILVAFTNYSKGHEPPTQLFTWIGFQNFINLFSGKEGMYETLPATLATTLSWTAIWAIAATFSNYILGIIVALIINKESIKFKKLWRTIFVMTIAIPQFISLLSIATLINEGGAVDELIISMTGASLGFAKTGHVAMTKFIIILVNIWVGIPYTILSTTGILLNIPKDLYESAKVDGAGTVKQFTKITMPYILFVTGPYLITSFVGNINNFNVIYFLTQGKPKLTGINPLSVGETDLMITFLYSLITNNANPQYGLASTVGIVIFIICAFISIVMYNKTGAIKEEDQFQ